MSDATRKVVGNLAFASIVIFGLWLSREQGYLAGKNTVIDAVNRARTEGLCEATQPPKIFQLPPLPSKSQGIDI